MTAETSGHYKGYYPASLKFWKEAKIKRTYRFGQNKDWLKDKKTWSDITMACRNRSGKVLYIYEDEELIGCKDFRKQMDVFATGDARFMPTSRMNDAYVHYLVELAQKYEATLIK